LHFVFKSDVKTRMPHCSGVGGEIVESDSDLLAELEDLEMKEDEEALLAQVASAPSVPAGTPKAAATLSSQPSREAQAAS
jgi:hypothetical protein